MRTATHQWAITESLKYLMLWQIPSDDDRKLLEGEEEPGSISKLFMRGGSKRAQLLGTLCSYHQAVAVIRENHTEWCEQIIAEFDVLLETFSIMMTKNVKNFESSFKSEDCKELFREAKNAFFAAPAIPMQHLQAISDSCLPDYIQVLQSRVMLHWIHIFTYQRRFAEVC